jgi:hypothetical protein
MMTDGLSLSGIVSSAQGITGSGVSAESAARFKGAYERAAAQLESADPTANSRAGTSSLLDPLLGLNSGSQRLASEAMQASGADLKPSELMMLTMRSHEFLFNCQLVTNIANRSSDGVQQLFKQQS